jgi:hypothetical protein
MADLQLELLRRNARLRAWRAVGVPVEGGWVHGAGVYRYAGEHPLVLLTLRCGSCGQYSARAAKAPTPFYAMPEALRRCESYHLQGYACPHLAPLLGDDPPEVLAILELELLAGDSPR